MSILASCCCRFDQPEGEWLLSNQPPGLLGAVQVYLDVLMEKVSSSDSLAEEVRGEGECYVLSCAQQCTLVLARVSGYWDNYGNLRTCVGTLGKSVLMLMNALLDMVSAPPPSLLPSLPSLSQV